MKKSSLFFSGAFVAGLLAPLTMEAQVFGYAGIKAGYSHNSADRLELRSNSGRQSNEGIYFNAFNAPSLPLGANVGLGYYFSPSFGFRAEAEYLYRIGLEKGVPPFDLDKGDSPLSGKIAISAQTLLSNFYLDYYVTPSLNLYVSAGAGMSFLNTKVSVLDTASSSGEGNDTTQVSKNSFVWQVGLGTGYAITQNLGLDFNVRYVGFGKLRAGINTAPTAQNAKGEASLSSIEALVGLNFRF